MMDELKTICAEVREFISNSALSFPTSHGSEEAFEELARRVFHFQFSHNLVYQAYCRHLGKTPGNLDSYRQMPAVVTSSFKDLDLTVLSTQERVRTFYSSGTTRSDRSRHFHNSQTLKVYEASLGRWFKRFVLPGRSAGEGMLVKFLCLLPRAGEAPHSSLVYMMEHVALRFGAETYVAEAADPTAGASAEYLGYVDQEGTWQTDLEQTGSFAEIARESKIPVVICGTAFSFVHLCDYLAERTQHLHFPPGSRVFETGGYKGRSREVPKEELHQLIQRWLGIPETMIISEYGMSELSSQAYDRVAGSDSPRCFRFPPWVRWEIVSPENGQPVREGETGLVRIWDLANVGSVLAIQTEDLATRSEDGFVLAGRAQTAAARGCSLMTG